MCFFKDVCLLRIDPGPCRATLPRWGYDSALGQCVMFIYGGCEGNANNYLTEQECQQSCLGGVLQRTRCDATTVTYCSCEPGFVWSGDMCVPREECGCVYEGFYHHTGEVFSTSDCEICICRGQNEEICRAIPCDVNAACIVKDGEHTCGCNPGYSGDGYECSATQCFPNPCENGGTCLPVGDGAEFECVCDRGWYGPLCTADNPCDPNPCSNGGQCVVLDDGSSTSCICPEGFGGILCNEVLGVCYARGDPHYKTFDNKFFDFQGDCTYILSQLCVDDPDLTDFKVVVDNEDYITNSDVAVTLEVKIYLYGVVTYEICLQRSLGVTVDGVGYPGATLPSGVTICYPGGLVVVKTDFGLQVTWDGLYNVGVGLPEEYQDKVCGLCGDYDGDSSNDCVDPTGVPVSGWNAFGNSWVYDNTQCELEPEGELPYEPCTGQADLENKSIEKCGIITGTAGVCPPGWVAFEERCYRFIGDQPRQQSAADNLCQDVNGELLEIQSAAENDYITSALTDAGTTAWLACSDADTEGTWTCPSGAGHMWAAGTGAGSTLGFFNWGTGEPSNSPNNQDCLALKSNGDWEADDCFATVNYALCQQPNNGNCPVSWTAVGTTKCMRVYANFPANFFFAGSICGQTSIALIESQAEQTGALTLVQTAGVPGVWLDCTDSSTEGTWDCSATQKYTVGGAGPSVNGYWSWGTDLPDGGSDENCLQFEDGNWNDVACSDTAHYTICERDPIILNGDGEAGPFENCNQIVDPNRIFSDCVYDMCATNCDLEVLCATIANYANLCRLNLGTVGAWRSPEFCPLICPEGSTYNPCVTACPATCENQDGFDECLDPCIEGCECDEGYVKDGPNCVLRETCSCTLNGVNYVIGATYVTAGCVQRCECQAGGSFVCEDIECHHFASCDTQNGERNCYCNAQYTGDGITNCVLSECVPDPCDSPGGGTCESRSSGEPLQICINCGDGYMGANCDVRATCDSYTKYFITSDAQTGTLMSPNYPELYNNFYISCYQIWVRGANYITLTFEDFQVEHLKDTLYIGPGFQYLADLDTVPRDVSTAVQDSTGGVYVLDGYRIPGPVVIGGDAAWLYFIADDNIALKGWKLSWQAGFDTFTNQPQCWNGYATFGDGDTWVLECGADDVTCTCDNGEIYCPYVNDNQAASCTTDDQCPGDQTCIENICTGGSYLDSCHLNPKCLAMIVTTHADLGGQTVDEFCAAVLPFYFPGQECLSAECVLLPPQQKRKRRDGNVHIAAFLEIVQTTNLATNETEILEAVAISIIEDLQSREDDGTLEVPIVSIEFNSNKFDFEVTEDYVEDTTPKNKSHVEVEEHSITTSLVAIFGAVGGVGILLLIALITAFIIIFRRRQKVTRKFDLREGAKNPKTEVIEMLEQQDANNQQEVDDSSLGASPFSTKLSLDDGAGGLDNVYALTYELGNPPPKESQA